MRLDPNEIVKKLNENRGKVRQTARELGISPQTITNWKKRASSGYGYLRHTGLTRASTAPKATRGTSLKAAEQDAVTAYRNETGYCAAKNSIRPCS